MKRRSGGGRSLGDVDNPPKKGRTLDAYYPRHGTRSSIPQLARESEEEIFSQGSECQTLEENILALLDTQGVKDASAIDEDKLSFLDAVHTTFLADRKAPTKKIYTAVLSCLSGSESMEVSVAGHKLLVDLGKAFPRSVQPAAQASAAQDVVSSMEASDHVLLPKLLKLSALFSSDIDENLFYQKKFLCNLLLLTRLAAQKSSSNLASYFRPIQHAARKAVEMKEVQAMLRDILNDDEKVSSFLQAMETPQQKLQVLSTMLKYYCKGCTFDGDLKGLFGYFADLKAARPTIIKSVNQKRLQLLLCKAFQVLLLLQNSDEDVGRLCNSFRTAVQSLYGDRCPSSMKLAMVVAEVGLTSRKV